MAIVNTNPIIRKDDNETKNSSFIRIISFNGLDSTENKTTLDVEFAFYLSKEKWLENWKDNRIKIYGLPNYRVKIGYNRSVDGVDIMQHIYTKLVEYLLLNFSDTWTIENISFDLSTPIE